MKDPGTQNYEHRRNGVFREVRENLYRYSSSGTYYAVFRPNGKLIWGHVISESLQPAERELAKRKHKEE